LKQFHRLATRYDERAESFAAMLTIAMSLHSHSSQPDSLTGAR